MSARDQAKNGVLPALERLYLLRRGVPNERTSACLLPVKVPKSIPGNPFRQAHPSGRHGVAPFDDACAARRGIELCRSAVAVEVREGELCEVKGELYSSSASCRASAIDGAR
jgi:hypothetical protein